MVGFFVAAFDSVHHDLLDVHLRAQLLTLSDVQHDFCWVGGQRHHIEFHWTSYCLKLNAAFAQESPRDSASR